MLSMGKSKPWPDELEAISGQRQMDATAILDYFAPLKKWLDEQNAGEKQGWQGMDGLGGIGAHHRHPSKWTKSRGTPGGLLDFRVCDLGTGRRFACLC